MSYNGGDELRRLKPMVRQTLDPIQINVGLCRWKDRFPESPEIRNLLFGPASCLRFTSHSRRSMPRLSRPPRLRSFSWVEKRFTRFPFSTFDRSFKCPGGPAIRRAHRAVGKVFVNVLVNKSIHLMAA